MQEYKKFYNILEDNLAYHGVTPTHTLEEFLDLKDRLGSQQMLIAGYNKDEHLVSGTWIIKACKTAWHTLYIAKDYEKGGHAATPCVLYRAMVLAKQAGVPYLNFGICTEDKGQTMNLGLFDFKESFGGETINRYQLLAG
jgi:lipid II:glycine glycyltransferase (peptidoglycan interpeptide bridge formation enzyme)